MNKMIIIVLLAVVAGVGFYVAQPGTPTSPSATITATKGKALVAEGALLIDARSPEEFSRGHVSGAINIPHTQIEARVAELGTDKTKTVVLYCQSGYRSGKATNKLREIGWPNAYNSGGIGDWQ